jgi:branched-chain amino acid transport system ATP-binding protein
MRLRIGKVRSSATDRLDSGAESGHLLSATDLSVGWTSVAAANGLSIHVERGEIVALVGPNGAGKSTTLLTLAGALNPIAGEARFLGEPISREPHLNARRGMAFVPEDRGLFPSLNVTENLRLRCGRKGRTTEDVLDMFPALSRRSQLPAGQLSGGEQQMLALAGALVCEPQLILVDELSLGLAPVVVGELLPFLQAVVKERNIGVLMVEQQVGLVLDVAHRAYVLDRGTIVYDGGAAELAQDTDLLRATYLKH